MEEDMKKKYVKMRTKPSDVRHKPLDELTVADWPHMTEYQKSKFE